MLNTHAATANLRVREQMICQHLPLIQQVVRKMEIDMPGTTIDFEDLVGYGTIGLIQAVDRFDDSLGFGFAAFAVPRIRGAVLDALRSLDHLSRRQRLMAKQITAKRNELVMTFVREPTEKELRNATGLAREQFNTARWAASFSCVPIANARDDGSPCGYPEPADPDDESPTSGIEREQLLAALQRAMKTLPERERMLVGLYYGERLTYREIATVLGVSDSRVAQLMHRALGRLRRDPGLVEAALPLSAYRRPRRGPPRDPEGPTLTPLFVRPSYP